MRAWLPELKDYVKARVPKGKTLTTLDMGIFRGFWT